jgi:hypothetical protein
MKANRAWTLLHLSKLPVALHHRLPFVGSSEPHLPIHSTVLLEQSSAAVDQCVGSPLMKCSRAYHLVLLATALSPW